MSKVQENPEFDLTSFDGVVSLAQREDLDGNYLRAAYHWGQATIFAGIDGTVFDLAKSYRGLGSSQSRSESLEDAIINVETSFAILNNALNYNLAPAKELLIERSETKRVLGRFALMTAIDHETVNKQKQSREKAEIEGEVALTYFTGARSDIESAELEGPHQHEIDINYLFSIASSLYGGKVDTYNAPKLAHKAIKQAKLTDPKSLEIGTQLNDKEARKARNKYIARGFGAHAVYAAAKTGKPGRKIALKIAKKIL